MLVLTRKVGECIMVGDDIKIVVTHIDAGKVRIGVHAPPEVIIDREEVRLAPDYRKHDRRVQLGRDEQAS